ncbi:MAG TPA: hypothetical protein VHL54_02760 [Actinomycetota bacterium]|nr:hypothetical protein [Actinomycetota bacterium]
MRPQRPGASLWTLRILAEACSQRDGGAASERVGHTRIDVYAGNRNADVPAFEGLAVSVVTHLTAVLGPPPVNRITVSPVAIPGPVRGMAGPGYLLIDSAELVSPPAWSGFRSSAGTEGTCRAWVLAHEMAHEWFPGTAALGPPSDEVAWEATAD